MNKPVLKLQRLEHSAGLPLPSYETEYSAGMDLRAAISDTVTIKAGERDIIPTGFIMAIPVGFEGQVRPRSGLAFKHGVTLTNSPGTIDADYRGEVKVLLINHGDQDFVISRGDRIAQLLITPVVQADCEEVDSLDETTRGAGGFGSTGVK
jgi:dUTP pyrophosphatase